MIPYLVLVVIAFLGIILNLNNKGMTKKKKIYLTVFFGICVTLIASIRSFSVGVDTVQYYYSYKYIADNSWEKILGLRYEQGFIYLCKILSYINSNPQTIIVVSSLIIFPSISYFIYKYSKNIYMSFYFYIILNLYFSHLNIMRQAIAIAIILYAIKFLLDGKNVKYIAMVLIASLFHSSAVICLLLLLLKNFKYNKKTYMYVMILSVVGFGICPYLLKFILGCFGKYESYLTSTVFGVSNYFGAVINYLIYLVIYTFCHIYHFKNENENDKTSTLFLEMLAMTCVFQAMAIKIGIVSRVVPYFFIAVIITLPNILCKIKKAKTRFLFITISILLAFIYWLIIVELRPEWLGAVPYLPFWNKTVIDWSGYFG